MRTSILKMSILVLLLACLVSCGGNKSADELPVIDVTKSYPEKAIVLQNIAQVEYIPLETGDDFLIDNNVFPEYIDGDYIIMRNWNSGDIMFFDRHTGKGIRKINRKGRGPGEYEAVSEIFVDRASDEMYVSSFSKKYLVYDLYGTFKTGV